MTDLLTAPAELNVATATPNEAVAGPTVLVVDDSSVARRFVGGIVENVCGFKAAYAKHGKEAVAYLKEQLPDAVVTDLNMPEMDGLELVEEIRSQWPQVPVILMTAFGSEDIAIQALRGGAASYVPKNALERDLADTLEMVLKAAKVDRRRQEFLECATDLDCRFALTNDPALIPVLISHLQENLVRMKLCDNNHRIRVGLALEESLLNGLYHGNLQLSSDLRQDGSDTYERLAGERRRVPPYNDRRLHVHARLTLTEAVFEIRDEGPGFDVSQLPDPTDPENMLKASGRGLLLIRTFMDEAVHNATGNQLTLTWRRKEAPVRRI